MIMKKRYIEPRIKVATILPENYMVGHSFGWADVKEKKDWDDDAWAEEVQTTEIKNPNLWDKEW